MQEAEQKFQAFLITQYAQDSYLVTPVQNRKLSILKMSIRESKQQSQNLMDSQFHHKFQNKTSSFQVQSQQNNEPIDYEKLLEAMTQAQITHNHDVDIMIKTLHSHPLTISDVVNHSVRAKASCYFRKQDSISAHEFEFV